jgi:hypothetical protein
MQQQHRPTIEIAEPAKTAVAVATENLWTLLQEHHRLNATWQTTRREQDRLAMVRSFSISITCPGSRFGDPATREAWPRCTPTVLSRDTAERTDHLEYRGACLGCGWVSDHTHRLRRGGENAAVEDAHDHTHPGWRKTPVVEAPPSLDSPQAYAYRIARWRQQWEQLLPAGWLDRGGPIRTPRTRGGTRHVPGRAPGGGYDLAAAPDAQPEAPGGQLGLFP